MMKRLLITLLPVVLFLTAQFSSCLFAQETQVINDSIYSSILKEQRSIKIVLPENYKPGSDEKYETIFLTDGEWILEPFSFIYKFAKAENYVPPVILVALPNTYPDKANQRDRDFLPVHVPEPAISGGADKFISFLKEELIPYIEKKYPANGVRSLYGHSYGGVFSAYVLFSQPELFDSYYSTDPAYWYNNHYIIDLASKNLANIKSDKVLWIAGIESTYKNMGQDRMDSLLKLKAPENLRWKFVTFPNEKHNSVRLKAIYDGLKYSYSGLTDSPLMFHPMNGIVLKDKPATIYIMDQPAELRYTLDGSMPDRKSTLVTSNFTISGPAQLVLKSFSTTGKYDKVARGNFEQGDALPSIVKPKRISNGGLKYSFYKGTWDKLPEFKKLKPSATGVADSTFTLSKLPDKTKFACLFEGYLEITEDGYYLFAVGADDGSKLYISDKLIIDNDGTNSTDNIKSFLIPLVKGFYPVRIEYFQKEDNSGLQFLYLKPGRQNPEPVPSKLLYRSK